MRCEIIVLYTYHEMKLIIRYFLEISYGNKRITPIMKVIKYDLNKCICFETIFVYFQNDSMLVTIHDVDRAFYNRDHVFPPIPYEHHFQLYDLYPLHKSNRMIE